jgi:hypothetical protein
VHVVFVLASKLRNVAHQGGHREDWETDVDTESLDDLILERVRSSEENDFGLSWPSLEELSTLIFHDTFYHFVFN